MEYSEPLRQMNAGYGHDTRVDPAAASLISKLLKNQIVCVNQLQHSCIDD